MGLMTIKKSRQWLLKNVDWLQTRVSRVNTKLRRINQQLFTEIIDLKHSSIYKFLPYHPPNASTDYSICEATKHLIRRVTYLPPIWNSSGSCSRSNSVKAEIFPKHNQGKFLLNIESYTLLALYTNRYDDVIIQIAPMENIKFNQNSKKAPRFDPPAPFWKNFKVKVLVNLTTFISASVRLKHVS